MAAIVLLAVVLLAPPAPAVTVEPTGSGAAAKRRADLVQRTLVDLEAWWRVELPKHYGQRFTGLSRYVPYTSRPTSRPPRCGDEAPPRYRDEAGNAYYCSHGDFIAWDDEGLLPQLEEDHGPVAVSIVLAHEMGHAVQRRADVGLDWLFLELQADCFAGAWLRRAVEGRGSLRHPRAAVDEAVSAMVSFSDDPGDRPDDEHAHGSAFDRVSALQVGYERGLARCVAFEDDPPAVTLAPFSSREEARSGGDLPLVDALGETRALLGPWWATTDRRVPPVVLRASTEAGVAQRVRACKGVSVFDGVAGVCPPTTTGGSAQVAYDRAVIGTLHREIGDFAVATVLAQSWSVLWQLVTGRPTADRSIAAEREATCATGAWARSLGPVGGDGRLSPGDLDEAVLTLLQLPGPATAFDAIAALRAGHGRGIRACR